MGDPAVHIPADARVVKVYESNSIEEVSSLVKQAFHSICFSGRLLAIHIVQGKSGQKKYEVICVFDNPERRNFEEFDKENLIAQQRIGLEDYPAAPNKPLYERRDDLIQVEVLAASVGVITLPAVIKRFYCKGLFYVNECIQEALVQTRLSSAYTCKLLDFSIRLGERCWLEVELVMERLQGNLEEDIKHRVKEKNLYTETELLRILECVAEALLFAKLRVRTT